MLRFRNMKIRTNFTILMKERANTPYTFENSLLLESSTIRYWKTALIATSDPFPVIVEYRKNLTRTISFLHLRSHKYIEEVAKKHTFIWASPPFLKAVSASAPKNIHIFYVVNVIPFPERTLKRLYLRGGKVRIYTETVTRYLLKTMFCN